MGGYGKYVWSSYSIALLVIVGNYLYARHAYRKILAKQREQHASHS